MNRSSANAYLVEEYRELATDAKFSSQQTTDAYSIAIDMSLRQLGFEESALASAEAAPGDTLKYLALLNYYTLNRFAKLLAIRFDVEAGQGAIKAARSQAFDRVKLLKAEAAAELTQYGISVGGVESFEAGWVGFDFNEPSATSEF